MSSQSPRKSRVLVVLAGIALLVVGAAAGYLLSAATAPPQREPALLWDDYIIAVAALYQRDGDLDAARERLAQLSTSDPGASVAALASIYVPDARYGESQARALRDLAVALTGRSVPVPTGTASARPQSGAAAVPGQDILRNPLLWATVLVGSLLWLLVVRGRDRRLSPGVAVAAPVAASAALPARTASQGVKTAKRTVRVSASLKSRLAGAIHPPARDGRAVQSACVSLAFNYDGGQDSLEEMQPITDPLTGRIVAGCGLTNGPRVGGEKGGYVGFLIWMHELASREVPQTLGLITDGAGEACKGAIAEWADYAQVDELVVARPGVARTFETRRMWAAVSVTELSQVKVRKAKHKVFKRLAIRLDVGFKEDTPHLARTRTSTIPVES